jgi:hypothetical protein
MALERLKSGKDKTWKKSFIGEKFDSYFLGHQFNQTYQKLAKSFVKFFDNHKDAFVKGAWFPDNVIEDNLTDGHTFKLKKPESDSEKKQAFSVKNLPPSHLSSVSLIDDKSRTKEKVFLRDGLLPDRCEALSHAIRDMMKIQNKESKGSDVMFNDDMITLYFLMLSHYIADAHVPPHSDSRKFYEKRKKGYGGDVVTIHPDMEKYWDGEVSRFFEYDKKRKVFDYGISGAPELKEKKQKNFEKSFLYDVLDTLSKRKWDPSEKKVLGNNKKIYDYIKSVCFVSYLVSTDFVSGMSLDGYRKVKIKKDPEYADKLRELSVHVLADAIDSIALLWLLAWERYFKLKEEVKKKAG